MVELAERLSALSGIPDAKVFLTTSGTEANEAALLAATSYRRSNQILALRNSYHGRSFGTDRDHREPVVVADEPVRAAGHVRARRLPAAQPVPRARRRRVHRRVRAGPARRRRHVHERRRRLHDRRADPRRRRVRDAARRLLRRDGARCSPSTGSCSSPTRCRPASVAPATTSGATRRTASRPTSSRWRRASATGSRSARVIGRADVLDSVPANSISTFGGNPLVVRGRAREPRVPAVARPAGQRAQAGRGARRRAAARLADAHPFIAEVRGRGLMLAIELCVPGTDDRLGGPEPWPAGAAAFMEATRAARAARRQGRALRQRVAHRAAARASTDEEIAAAIEIMTRPRREEGATHDHADPQRHGRRADRRHAGRRADRRRAHRRARRAGLDGARRRPRRRRPRR